MKRRRRGTEEKKRKERGKKKKRTMNGSICMVNAVARMEEKNAGGKIASTLATRKKGGEKSAIPAGVASKKRTTHRVLCRTRPMVERRKAKKERRWVA